MEFSTFKSLVSNLQFIIVLLTMSLDGSQSQTQHYNDLEDCSCTEAPDCKSAFTRVHGTSKYFWPKSMTSFSRQDAVKGCKKYGFDLATIDSLLDSQVLGWMTGQSNFSRSYWLDYKWSEKDKEFLDSYNEPTKYPDWLFGQPARKEYLKLKPCVIFAWWKKMMSKPCKAVGVLQHPSALCQFHRGSKCYKYQIPQNKGSNKLLQLGNSRFFVSTHKLPVDEAVMHCDNEGKKLAPLSRELEKFHQELIGELLHKETINKKSAPYQKGTKYWVSGEWDENMTFPNVQVRWNPGEPKDDSGDGLPQCLELELDWKNYNKSKSMQSFWSVTDCREYKFFICQDQLKDDAVDIPETMEPIEMKKGYFNVVMDDSKEEQTVEKDVDAIVASVTLDDGISRKKKNRTNLNKNDQRVFTIQVDVEDDKVCKNCKVSFNSTKNHASKRPKLVKGTSKPDKEECKKNASLSSNTTIIGVQNAHVVTYCDNDGTIADINANSCVGDEKNIRVKTQGKDECICFKGVFGLTNTQSCHEEMLFGEGCVQLNITNKPSAVQLWTFPEGPSSVDPKTFVVVHEESNWTEPRDSGYYGAHKDEKTFRWRFLTSNTSVDLHGDVHFYYSSNVNLYLATHSYCFRPVKDYEKNGTSESQKYFQIAHFIEAKAKVMYKEECKGHQFYNNMGTMNFFTPSMSQCKLPCKEGSTEKPALSTSSPSTNITVGCSNLFMCESESATPLVSTSKKS